MASLMTRSVILLLCWAMVGVCSAEVSIVEKFLDFYNGIFDNTKLSLDVGILSPSVPVLPLVQARAKRVSVPVLNGPVFYFEEAILGQVVLAIVCEVAELPTKNGVIITVYNATDASRYRFNEFNTTDLSTYDRDAFQLYEGCPKYYYLVSERFVGTWVNCRSNGKQDKFLEVINNGSADFITTKEELALYGALVFHVDRVEGRST